MFVDAADANTYRPWFGGTVPQLSRRAASGIRDDGQAPRSKGEDEDRTRSRRRAARQDQGGHQRGEPVKDRLSALERERDALRADLQRAEARVRELEKTQAQVRDRIAWALDSLHNILDGKG